ncbi:MAG TPA: ferritin-like domain-containing protein [Pyrinomonadaceae bacterium]
MTDTSEQATEKLAADFSAARATAPTGSERKARREIIEAVNPVIADGFALYEKTKSFSLSADESFPPGNELLLDAQAEEIFASMDTLAEHLRQIGAAPPRSISHSGELESVENYQGGFLSPDEMRAALIADNRRLAASSRAAVKICEKMCAAPLGIILQDILDKTESRIKLLNESEMNF